MSWILKRFLEAGLIDGDTSVQLKTWGIDVPSVPEKAIRTRQDLEQFLEDLDTDVFRHVEGVPPEVELERSGPRIWVHR